jgi:hypothetical protein
LLQIGILDPINTLISSHELGSLRPGVTLPGAAGRDVGRGLAADALQRRPGGRAGARGWGIGRPIDLKPPPATPPYHNKVTSVSTRREKTRAGVTFSRTRPVNGGRALPLLHPLSAFSPPCYVTIVS